MAITTYTERFRQAYPTAADSLCSDSKSKSGHKTVYRRDCRYHKEDPAIIVKWMRRNFGERHQGWDFSLVGGCVTIELWDDRLITMYEMWQT
jgi:hypothetical protein